MLTRTHIMLTLLRFPSSMPAISGLYYCFASLAHHSTQYQHVCARNFFFSIVDRFDFILSRGSVVGLGRGGDSWFHCRRCSPSPHFSIVSSPMLASIFLPLRSLSYLLCTFSSYFQFYPHLCVRHFPRLFT